MSDFPPPPPPPEEPAQAQQQPRQGRFRRPPPGPQMLEYCIRLLEEAWFHAASVHAKLDWLIGQLGRARPPAAAPDFKGFGKAASEVRKTIDSVWGLFTGAPQPRRRRGR